MQKDLDTYKSYLSENHLLNSSLGASFNPGFLLLFTQKTERKFVNQLLHGHEFAHSRLSFSFYGRLIFFLKFILIDFISYSVSNKHNKQIDKKIISKLREKITLLINNWVVTHEGYATYHDYMFITTSDDVDAEKYLSILNNFLQQESPYSSGFSVINNLLNFFSWQQLNAIIHEIGNINYLNNWNDFFSPNKIHNEDIQLFPDKLLKEISSQLTNYKNGKLIIYDSMYKPYFGRWIIKEHFSNIDFIEYETGKVNMFSLFANRFINSSFFPDYYTKRLVFLKNKYFENYKFVEKEYYEKSKLPYEWIFVPAEKELINNVQSLKIQENSMITKDDIDAMNYLNKVNYIYENNEKTGQDNFLSLFNKFDLVKSNQYYPNVIDKVFPTPIGKFKLKKIHTKNFNFLNLIDMNKVVIKCSPEEAVEFQNILKEKQASFETDKEIKNELSHWLEYANIAITLLASSVTIVDMVIKWFKKKKSENKSITINIDNREYNLQTDYIEIDKKLNIIKQEIEKQD